MKKFFHKRRKVGEKGFTIIEMMIAIAIFLIVITIGISALMNLYSVNRKAQNMRNILDGLSFAMEDMSRNIRTGYNYSCLIKGQNYSVSELSDARDCISGVNNGRGIAFEYSDGDTTIFNDQWVYFIDGGKLYRSTDAAVTKVQLTPDEVVLDGNAWSFSVYGSLNTDTQQPIVILRLVGKILDNRGGDTPFSLQTTVSQRLIDVKPND